jgi:transcriptional regulator with XRE-family HTH domain
MDYSAIKALCDKRRISIKELAVRCGITEAGLHQMLRNQSMKIDILEKIAEVLNVSVGSFFESSVVPQSTDGTESHHAFYTENAKGIMLLHIPAEEKIKLLRDTVQLLYLTTEAQKKVIAAHEAEIKRLKGGQGIS